MGLMEETIELLARDKGNWPVTAKDTGLGREWISKLSQGLIADPGINKIERLHHYLSQKYENQESAA